MVSIIFMGLIKSYVDLSGHYHTYASIPTEWRMVLLQLCVYMFLITIIIIIYIKKNHDAVTIKKSWNGRT